MPLAYADAVERFDAPWQKPAGAEACRYIVGALNAPTA